jgi:uncharacterized membrane protein
MAVTLLTVVILAVPLIYFISKTLRLEREVGDLRWDLIRMKQLLDQLWIREHEQHEPQKPVTQSAQAAESPKPSDAVQPEKPRPPARPPVQAVAEPFGISTSPVPPVSEPVPSRTREEWEAFVGGKLLNRIGAVALILGVGFFMKEAFDRNWISEPVRVIIGAVVGLLCLAGAYRTHSRGLKIFAQGLVGAGISILYLSVYASFNFYALVPQWIAFILMSIVTVLSLAQALYYDSLAVALLGLAGGFLTPIMLSTGSNNEVGLFTYLALLNAGLLGMLVRKDSWSVVEPVSFVSTWLLYAAWHSRYYTPDALWLTVFFVVLFWLLYYALDVVRVLRSGENFLILHHVMAVANGVVFFSVLYSLVDQFHHPWMGAVTLGIGLIYFATIMAVKLRVQLPMQVMARYIVSAIVLLAAATTIQFHDFTTVIVWSLEALVLFWCGLRWRMDYVWGVAGGLMLCALLKFFATDGALAFVQPREFVLLLNQRSLTLLTACVSVGLCGLLMTRHAAQTKGDAVEATRDLLNVGWCALLFFFLSIESSDYFRFRMLDQSSQTQEALAFTRLMSFSVLWAACALPLVWLGVRNSIMTITVTSSCILGLAVILAAVRGIAFEPIEVFAPVLNVRVGAMVAVLAGMILFDRALRQSTAQWDWLPGVLSSVGITMALFLLLLLTGETRDFFEKQITDLPAGQTDADWADAMEHIHNLQQLLLSGVWLLYSVVLMAFGFWRSGRNLRIVAFVLFGITILKVFVYDLSFLERVYRIFSFIGLGVILLAVSYAYQRYKNVIFSSEVKV